MDLPTTYDGFFGWSLGDKVWLVVVDYSLIYMVPDLMSVIKELIALKGLFFVLLSVFLTKCSNRNLILIKDYEISFVLIRPFFFILNIVFAFKYSTS